MDDTAEDVAPINFDELDALDAMMPDSTCWEYSLRRIVGGDEKK